MNAGTSNVESAGRPKRASGPNTRQTGPLAPMRMGFFGYLEQNNLKI